MRKKIDKKAFEKMVKANLEATEAIVKALECRPEKEKSISEYSAWKDKWHNASRLAREAIENGAAECPCGDKEYLSNFFPTFGDHNMYCSTCISAMTQLITVDDSDERDMGEKYGEPGELWKKINN